MQPVVQQVQSLLGVTLKSAWIQNPEVQQARTRDELLSLFLWSDISDSSEGCLPENWRVLSW
jgi:hypothetical protein